jgi:hypothetical protein
MRETRIKALLERRAATALNIIDEASAVEGADFVMYTECRQVLGGMAQEVVWKVEVGSSKN